MNDVRRRPGRPPNPLPSVRVALAIGADDLATIDAARGTTPRATWIAREAIGVARDRTRRPA